MNIKKNIIYKDLNICKSDNMTSNKKIECFICSNEDIKERQNYKCSKCNKNLCKSCLSRLSRLKPNKEKSRTNYLNAFCHCPYCKQDLEYSFDIKFFNKEDLFNVMSNASSNIEEFVEEVYKKPLEDKIEKLIHSTLKFRDFRIHNYICFINKDFRYMVVYSTFRNEIINYYTMINNRKEEKFKLEDNKIYKCYSTESKEFEITKEQFEKNLIDYDCNLIKKYEDLGFLDYSNTIKSLDYNTLNQIYKLKNI
jgi:hypothetical protein